MSAVRAATTTTSTTGYCPRVREFFLNSHHLRLQRMKMVPMRPPSAPSSRKGMSSKNIQGLEYST